MNEKVYSKYCCCIIIHNIRNDVLWEGCEHRLDSMTFPNPDKEPLALEDCKARAKFLRENTNEMFKKKVLVQPVIIQTIPE